MYSCCGRFVKVEGLSKWKVCQRGRFVKVEGLSKWKVCQSGSFVKVEGLSKWKVCQSGRFVKVMLRVLSPSLKVFGNCCGLVTFCIITLIRVLE